MTMRRHLSALLVAGLLALGAGLTGCGGNGKVTKQDETPTATEKKPKTRKPKAPMPENLADSPCGNPKWGQLPEQHDIDGDPEEGEATDDDGESAADSETSAGEPAKNDEASDN